MQTCIDFLNKSQKEYPNKKKETKLDFVEIKNVYSSKGIVKKIGNQTIDWEKNLQNIHLTKDWYSGHVKFS